MGPLWAALAALSPSDCTSAVSVRVGFDPQGRERQVEGRELPDTPSPRAISD
jgi:hypothetical protein